LNIMLHYAPEHFTRAQFPDTTPTFGDCASAEELITRHSQLVRRIAWHVHSRMGAASELEDLMQIGLIALVDAGRGYEDRGHAFTTYASTRVRGAMIDHLRREALTSRSAMTAQRRIGKAKSQLEQRLMRSPTAAEIAADLGMDIDRYHAFAAAAEPVEQASIDDLYSDHDLNFGDSTDGADTVLEKAEMGALLAEAIGHLPEREAQILQLYFVEEMNLHEIGAIMGTGAARICQIKKSALAKLRIALSDHG
jgi:RNA polymerase sigma factor FliA